MPSVSLLTRSSLVPLFAGALLLTVGCAGRAPSPSTAPSASIPAAVSTAPVAPAQSVFDLEDMWYSPLAPAAKLSSLNGALVVVGFVNDECDAACTTTLNAMRALERETDSRVHFVVVSNSGENGTPATLAAFAKTRRLPAARFTMISSNPTGIANLIAALNRSAGPITAAELQSRSVISVLDYNGIAVRQRGEGTIDALLESLQLLENMR